MPRPCPRQHKHRSAVPPLLFNFLTVVQDSPSWWGFTIRGLHELNVASKKQVSAFVIEKKGPDLGSLSVVESGFVEYESHPC